MKIGLLIYFWAIFIGFSSGILDWVWLNFGNFNITPVDRGILLLLSAIGIAIIYDKK